MFRKYDIIKTLYKIMEGQKQNMKFRWDNRYLRLGVTAFLVIAASMLFYYGIFHMKTLLAGIKSFLSIMAPIIYGIAIAFLLSPVLNFLEKKVIYPILKKRNISLEKRGKRVVRWICVLVSMCFLIAIIYALIMMIIPQLIRSIMNLIYSFPHYVNVVQDWLRTFIEKGWDLNENAVDMVEEYTLKLQDYLTKTLLPQMQSMLKNISAGVFDVITFLKNFIIGAIVSLYLMADKESFIAKGKMLAYAFFPTRHANFIIHSMRFTSQTFIGFISGKILDSAIIGVLCYIGTTIMDMPYALLVSVIIGVTNIIPFFGPYLGAIPCIFLILLADPIKSLYFAIFILALQQFDGNILGPKILGDSTGLSSFMVIVAILVGGGLFGIPGMLIGVPVFAVFYAAAQKLIRSVLIRRKMPENEADYMNIDCLDTDTKEPLMLHEEESPRKREGEQRRTAMLELCVTIWKTLQKILNIIWDFLKKAWSVVSAKCRQVWQTLQKKIQEKKTKEK